MEKFSLHDELISMIKYEFDGSSSKISFTRVWGVGMKNCLMEEFKISNFSLRAKIVLKEIQEN